MSFLAPLFLLGGLAVTVPVIFHLVRRTTRERRPFGSLMFLKPSPPRLSRRSRIEHWLLLLLRCVVLALLAFGFARPFLRKAATATAPGAAPRRVLVLLDQSASMRRADLWLRGQAEVRRVLRGLGAHDEAAVWTFAREVRTVMDFDAWTATPPGQRLARVTAQLGALQPTWEATRLDAALMRAADRLIEGSEPGTIEHEVVLISDLQEGSRLNGLQAYEWPAQVRLSVRPLPAPEGDNAGLAFAGLTEPSEDAPRQARLRVVNDAASQGDTFTLRWLDAAGRPVGDPVAAEVRPGHSRLVRMDLPAGSAAEVSVRLEGDQFPFDNTVYILPPPAAEATVLYLGNDVPAVPREPLFFLERAFQETPRQQVHVRAYRANAPPPASELAAARLIVVNGEPAPTAARAVHSRVSAGATALFLNPGQRPAAPPRWRGGTPPHVLLAEVDFEHPLFSVFADPRFSDFTKIRFWRHAVVDEGTLPAPARVLARFDDGSPALIETPRGQGRELRFFSGWATADSTLALSTKFVPLLYSLLELSGERPAAPAQHLVGDVVLLTEGPALATPVTVRRPDGAWVTVQPGGNAFGATAMPGVFRAQIGPAERVWAVNLEPAESRTAALGAGELAAYTAREINAPLSPVATPDPAALRRADQEARQKLWRRILAGAAGVLLVETLLAGWATRRQQRMAEATT